MLSSSRRSLIVPVEGQVRELDAKILLACVAARRGFSVIIGRRLAVDARITSFPRGVYLSKDVDAHSIEMFRIIHGLGHEIVAWDEEALVHFPPTTHFTRRMSPVAMQYVSHLLAWGPDNADLWRRYPQFPGLPIHITGNPRTDLLRPEMRAYFQDEVRKRRDAYGDFFLVNTNFSLVNSKRELFEPVKAPGERPALGRGGFGMTREFAEHLRSHKKAVFEDFQCLIPDLERAFPDLNIVIRPHPSEIPKVYHEIAAGCERVEVENSGSVIPWLMAARAVIHNGCTTGVEANLLGVPTIAYGPNSDGPYDFGRAFWLPNSLSHQCPDFETLCLALKKILVGELGCACGEDHRGLIDEFLTPQDGSLASERIVDVLEEFTRGRSDLPRPPLFRRLDAWRRATTRRFGRSSLRKALRESTRKYVRRPELRRALYQEVSLPEMRERISRFQRILGEPEDLAIERLAKSIYRISA